MSQKSQPPDPPSDPITETVCSSPLLPDLINLTKQPRLADSRWNLDQTKTDFSDFSSDPLTGTEFLAGINTTKTNHQLSKKRTSSALTDPHYHPSKYTRVGSKTGTNPSIVKVKTSFGNILDARDLLVEAYYLTKDRVEQTNLLDLIEIFRKITENKSLKTAVDMEQINKPKPQPSNTDTTPTPTPTTPLTPEPCALPNHLPTYAEKLKAFLPTQGPGIALPLPVAEQEKNQPNKATTATSDGSATNTACLNLDKIITLVTTKGKPLPFYQATQVRDSLNKVLGRKAIARVHTSPHQNLVLTCLDASAEEVLSKLAMWKPIFEGWPISEVQRVNNWPKLVVHGVPTSIPISQFKDEAEDYNSGLQIQGAPRWLLKQPQKAHSSVVFTVKSEDEKQLLKKRGILIGGLLLRVVNYQSTTHKTQCRNCLKFGHHSSSCRNPSICAICRSTHSTAEHSCATCHSSQGCNHFQTKCANCNSPTHNALQKHSCEVFKVLTC